ncbi:MAG: AAA family ATPase [Hominisplanchenecus sp.]|nr:AAA family ATPase [Lachnospiraceae bacterium]MDY2820390.1 AAA family ATPase [Hominisplanchenecus sp.]
MNIKRAKEEIKNTIEAYLLKNVYGEYEIPAIRQRPVLLLGAPGIGKTQIMEQIAKECQVGLVSYTITHHTRQSAIGLPFISKKEFGGKEYAVTEYTMSEIVASIYEKMEKTGLSEGILFIDEINCVSETLAPAMLQFLQCKTFGSHEIPGGWIIVAAGNPPEYNKSVREFDVVTMDRVKKIEVEPDFEVWKEYAYKQNIHPAVISYLNARPRYFYRMETTVDGRKFATPRGWEDLSRMLEVYEKLHKTADREMIVQYIQHEKIAKDFANYLELYEKYQMDYQIEAVLEGKIDDILIKKAAHASFDERLSVISLLLSRCTGQFRRVFLKEQELAVLFEKLRELKEGFLGLHRSQPQIWMAESVASMQGEYEQKKQAELLTREEDQIYRLALELLERYALELEKVEAQDGDGAFALVKTWFGKEQDTLEEMQDGAEQMLEHVFDFMELVFGTGQEMVVWITELNSNYYSVRFLQEYDCERYYRYNKELLFEESSRSIEARLQEL